jgi:hypothetical protein
LGAGPERLLADLEWFGLLFAGEVFPYRDGGWGAIEITLGEGQVNRAATRLRRFAEAADPQRSGPPAFLAVICGKGYGYRRLDGIAVVPVGALGGRCSFRGGSRAAASPGSGQSCSVQRLFQ